MTQINWGWLFAFLGLTAMLSILITYAIPNTVGFLLSVSAGIAIGGFGVR